MSKRHPKSKLFIPRNPQKYTGDVYNIVSRSSWETGFMCQLDLNPNVISWSSEETIIPYIHPLDNRYHRYFVDFKATFLNNKKEITTYLIEIKPKHQSLPPVRGKKREKTYINECITYSTNIEKWKAAESFCEKKGYKFIVMYMENNEFIPIDWHQDSF